MTSDALRETFFAECEELVESLTANLELISADDWDKETINAVFRAVHSIKGAAGAFGFTDLVDFAHHYETVLDAVRSDKLTIDGDVLRLVIRSSDILAELVDCCRAEGMTPPAATADVTADLVQLIPANDASDDDAFSFAPAAIDFAPLALPLDNATTFEVTLDPNPTMYLSGHDPINLIRGLQKLGKTETVCQISNVPSLDAFDFDESYLTWVIRVEDAASEAEIEDVFGFVEGLCDLTIKPIEAPHAEKLSTELEPEQTAALSATVPSVEKATPEETTTAAKPIPSANSATKLVQTTLRVDPERVDRLINSVGELIINQAVIDRNLKESGLVSNTEITAALDDYGNLAREIQEAVMAIRAQPVKSLFQRMGRVVREAGEATQKPVKFITDGEATEIDKTMLERLADPLTHMLRNAVDHGIESPEQREAAGKSPDGAVRLSASHRSGHVVIEISDDGAGLNRDKILAKAVEKSIVAPDANLSEAEIYALLFAPGFSTAENVTNLSGRGVGMDVVKTAITSLGGKVSITSVQGEGSVFAISLPLTLAVLDGMIVEVGSEKMVLPLSCVVETVRPSLKEVLEVGPGEYVLAIRGSFVPIVDLRSLLGFASDKDCTGQGTYVLIDTNAAKFAVAVESILDQRQVVIKSLKGNYGKIDGVSAATILGDGNVALIIDPDALMALASRRKASSPMLELEGQH